MSVSHAQDSPKTRVGIRQMALALSALIGAVLANLLVCRLFIFASETGGHKRLPAFDETHICRAPDTGTVKSPPFSFRSRNGPPNF